MAIRITIWIQKFLKTWIVAACNYVDYQYFARCQMTQTACMISMNLQRLYAIK